MPRSIQKCRRIGRFAFVLSVVNFAVSPAAARAQDTSGLNDPTGRRPVKLWPPATQPDETDRRDTLTLGGWTYRSQKSDPRDGVPWELIVTPASELSGKWQRGEDDNVLPAVVGALRGGGDVLVNDVKAPSPIVEVPDILWKSWMDTDLQDVVGIHFHEVVATDTARLLFTIHKVPPDEPDGSPAKNHAGASGSRIEATLLAPIAFSLDQTIVARVDPVRKELTRQRWEHEAGHAEVSQKVFTAVLRGPQDWNPAKCTGRRSRIVYYWNREEIGRSWRSYRDGVGKILAMRTTVVVVPPTRWTKMLPIPPERVTARHLQQFNDEIVQVSQRFAEVDSAAQERFHSHAGSFEQAGP